MNAERAPSSRVFSRPREARIRPPSGQEASTSLIELISSRRVNRKDLRDENNELVTGVAESYPNRCGNIVITRDPDVRYYRMKFEYLYQ